MVVDTLLGLIDSLARAFGVSEVIAAWLLGGVLCITLLGTVGRIAFRTAVWSREAELAARTYSQTNPLDHE